MGGMSKQEELPKPPGLKTPFELGLDYIFVNEGGFSNVPQDHGEATNWGITREEASRWRKKPVSVAEMKAFPKEEAMAIYEAWYWKPVGADKIKDPGVAICMFDIGIVRGIGVPPRYAQTICNRYGAKLTPDNHIGPLTIAAINQVDPRSFIHDFSGLAEAGFRAIVANDPSQGVFLNGWVNRAHRLLTLS